ncbi:unnamed protein product [Rodentolepis nana]|uniref:Uncharacterized protein n=1 Tax=Rodentolepis nana TaxID=102285 RepID=A0A158QHA7_RODNA|nr:unnamed protein product [Rodentolepis nana]
MFPRCKNCYSVMNNTKIPSSVKNSDYVWDQLSLKIATATLQTVTNIISAYQANFQKQHAQAQVMANMQKQGQSLVNLQRHQGQTSVPKQEEKQPTLIQTQANAQKPQQQVQQTQQQQRVTTFPENVRFTTQVPSIIINRTPQQHLQAAHTAQINSPTAGQQASISVSNNTRIAHSTAVLSTPQRGAWGNQVSQSPSSTTSQLTNSLPTAQIIRPQSTQQRTLPQQQQQQIQTHSQQSSPQVQFQQFQQQQQFRAAVAGMVSRNPLDYISWTRQFSTSQGFDSVASVNPLGLAFA